MNYGIAIAPTRALSLYRLFDELTLQGHSMLVMQERNSPGATDALRAWAESQGHAITERAVTPPGSPTLVQLTVRVRSRSGSEGPHISVQREQMAVTS